MASDHADSIPFPPLPRLGPEEMRNASDQFHRRLDRRRSIREFSPEAIPDEVVENCVRAASTSPSGAHRQPWHFCVVRSVEIKRRIREAAEAEEREFYGSRAPDTWLEALKPIGTDADKPFLETAPCLIAIFARNWETDPATGDRLPNYYVKESVGIATGLLITALHECGLSTLTHTPSPMQFLNEILDRPGSEKPFLLLVIGHAAEGATVPDLKRRPLEDVASFH